MRNAAHALAVAFACVVTGSACANPTGAEVVAGQVDIVSSPNRVADHELTGRHHQLAELLDPAGRTDAVHPAELVEQRVESHHGPGSHGRSSAPCNPTARSLLINPNGILFGAGARVDVNGLVASTLNLSNADFLAGKLQVQRYDRAAGDVSNQGAITTPSGGQVYLIGSSVTNGGVITSPGGDVVLAAGQSVDLADSNDPDVRVVISAPGSQALNVGKVVAESGRVGIYGALVNQMGRRQRQ